MRRSRKPLSVVRRIEGSNPSPSAQPGRNPQRCAGFGRSAKSHSGRTSGVDGVVKRLLLGAGRSRDDRAAGSRRLACGRQSELVMSLDAGREQDERAASSYAQRRSWRDRGPTRTTLSVAKRRPLFLHSGLPSPGVGGQEAKDDPQDLPHARRGACLAPGNPSRAPQGNPARALPDHPRAQRRGKPLGRERLCSSFRGARVDRPDDRHAASVAREPARNRLRRATCDSVDSSPTWPVGGFVRAVPTTACGSSSVVTQTVVRREDQGPLGNRRFSPTV